MHAADVSRSHFHISGHAVGSFGPNCVGRPKSKISVFKNLRDNI